MENDNRIPDEIRKKVRILVVEDNLLNQQLDAFLLSNWGLKHEICGNGRQAIDRLLVARFDLVLMDIRMPELDGFEATKIIRNQLGMEMPIIGITAHANPQEKARCLAEGMNNYLSKPVDEDKLFRILCGHLVRQQVENVAGEEE